MYQAHKTSNLVITYAPITPNIKHTPNARDAAVDDQPNGFNSKDNIEPRAVKLPLVTPKINNNNNKFLFFIIF